MGIATLERDAVTECDESRPLRSRTTKKGDWIMNDGLRLVLSSFLLLFVSVDLFADSTDVPSTPSMILVVGAGGNPQYEISFYQWSERWAAAAKQAGVSVTVIGRHRGETGDTTSDYQRLQTAIEEAGQTSKGELWIVLIGHGTFDRRVAKFNLRGPDVSAEDLSQWLKPVERRTALINCSSSSGPFVPVLTGPNRIVITATKSGTEINYSRFGDYLSQAINDPTADLDKDDQTSLWEAFLMASRRTTEYYDTDGRIETEHAILDDNGDGQGARADQFRGLIPIAKPTDGQPLDGRRAHQWHLVPNATEAILPAEVRTRRNDLELSIEQLRDRKDEMSHDDYLSQLEQLLVDLAELNERLE
jgi:hypothetical protein